MLSISCVLNRVRVYLFVLNLSLSALIRALTSTGWCLTYPSDPKCHGPNSSSLGRIIPFPRNDGKVHVIVFHGSKAPGKRVKCIGSGGFSEFIENTLLMSHEYIFLDLSHVIWVVETMSEDYGGSSLEGNCSG